MQGANDDIDVDKLLNEQREYEKQRQEQQQQQEQPTGHG
jgi:hypothetical protein